MNTETRTLPRPDPVTRPITALASTTVLCGLVIMLPLMMGQRTPETLTASLLVMVTGSFIALALSAGRQGLPNPGWLWFAGGFSAMVMLHVWPSTTLAQLFGPYPQEFFDHPSFHPAHWSPDPGASLRSWATFTALFAIAWLGYSMSRSLRRHVWLALVGMALFQALYGLLAQAADAETILGIWERESRNFPHGSFSNRNIFAAYLALAWPMAVSIWWIRDVPGLKRLPRELKVTGSVLCGSIIGAAILGSGSRLGAAAGIFAMLLALILWGRHRRLIRGASVWPIYLASAGAFASAVWYGLTPLAERLLATTGEELRLEFMRIMLTEFPRTWYLHGIGLGGFEAAFRPFQESHFSGWLDYAHNDLLQWLVETGLPGLIMMLFIGVQILRKFRLTIERIALYSGLAALSLVALGDFSWHIPATQIVLAFYIGVLLR